jgi:type II secretory pathway component PulF
MVFVKQYVELLHYQLRFIVIPTISELVQFYIIYNTITSSLCSVSLLLKSIPGVIKVGFIIIYYTVDYL